MTIPGMVAEQPALPSRAGVERVRASGGEKEPATATDEAAEGFADLLGKLIGGEELPTEEPANDNRTDVRRTARRDIGVPMARDNSEEGDAAPQSGGDGVPTEDPLGVDAPADAMPEVPQVDTQVAALRPADAKSADAIAAILNAPPAQLTAVAQAPQVAEPQIAVQGTDPAVARRAVLDGSASAGEAQLAAQPARASKAQPDESETDSAAASAPDFVLASEPASEPAPVRSRDAPTHAEKASVVAQETHFAPVAPTPAAHARAANAEAGNAATGLEAASSASTAPAPAATTLPTGEAPAASVLSPAQQIADRIADEMPAFEATQQTSAATGQADAKPVLKVLQIQLQPADLGTVTVRMELKDAEIKLHVEADRPETAEMIRSDQDTLSKLLRSAGYSVDPGSIRVADGDRSVTPTQAGQQGPQANLQSSTQSHQSQQGFSERQERPQRGATANGSETQTPSSRNETNETTNRTGRDLYI